jgi:shikimate kinase
MKNESLKNKNILVVGMAGTGKTFVSKYLKDNGINAFDGDEVEALSAWYNNKGEKVTPKDLTPESLNGLEWNWDSEIIKKLHQSHKGTILFGVSSNWHNLLHLFDKVFFLFIDPETTRQRLLSSDRENDYGKDSSQVENIVKHIDGFKRFALEHG